MKIITLIFLMTLQGNIHLVEADATPEQCAEAKFRARVNNSSMTPAERIRHGYVILCVSMVGPKEEV